MREIIAVAVVAACLNGSSASAACAYDYAAAVAHAKTSNSLSFVGQGGRNTVVNVIAKLRTLRPQAGTTTLGAVLHDDEPYREDATESAMFKFARDPSQSIVFFGKAECVVQIVRLGSFGVMSLDPAKYALQPF